MNLIMKDDEIEEILIEDVIKSNDFGKVISKSDDGTGKRGKDKAEFVKEMIALDAVEIGPSRAALIHDVDRNSVHDYLNGERLNEDAKTKVLSARHNITDTAIAKLMETLDLFDPNDMEKPADIVRAAGVLAGIVERVTSKERSDGPTVVLNLYNPRQRKIEDYEIIHVK